MAAIWPLPTNKVVGDPGFVTDINQMAENVNSLDGRATANQNGLSAHEADTSNAHMASAIGVTPGGLILSTNVQAALAEVASATDTHVTKVSGAHAASAISYAGGLALPASSVEAALDALDGREAAVTIPAGTNANTLVSERTYIAYSTTAATAALNYPLDGFRGFIQNTRNAGGTNVSQVASATMTGGALGRTWARTLDAGIWSPWREQLQIGIGIAGGTITGTGSPEGSVVAVIGTRYVDTAATAGAIVWEKWEDGGATGWKVSLGDTGPRNLASYLAAGVTATRVTATREGNRVTVAFTNLSRLNAFEPVLILPPGMEARPADGYKHFAMRGDVISGRMANFLVVGGAVAYVGPYDGGAAFDPDERFTGNVDFVTANLWPSPLPGTAG